MLLFLMRHCEAQEGERNDSSRQLTPEGWRQAEQMGEFLRREIGSAEIVMTSPYARASDTAMTVARALGCQHVPQSNWLDPDADVNRAWDHIASTAGKRETVVVVTHHPLVNALLEKLTNAKTDDAHYKHGAIAHLNTESGKLHWFVTPKLIERDEDLLDAAADVAEAAAQFANPEFGVVESLKHPKHAAHLAPIREKVTEIMQRFFRRQRIALLKEIDTHLKHLGDGNRNVKEDYTSTSEVDSVLPKGSLLPLAFSSGMAADYAEALSAALVGGYEGLADEFDSDGEMSRDIVEEYLRDHSLRRLTGNINATTVERLRNALADTYEAGGNYYDLKQAVIDEYENFSDVRAGMIAQTEMNGAWNAGRKQLGVDLGFNEKAWNPDATACPLCLLNVAEGWIGMDDEFGSGDDAPPLHPNCDCSLDVRYNAQASES